jgi:hypothetical protein
VGLGTDLGPVGTREDRVPTLRKEDPMEAFLNALKKEVDAKKKVENIDYFLRASVNIAPDSIEKAERRLTELTTKTNEAFDDLSDDDAIAVQKWLGRFQV